MASNSPYSAALGSSSRQYSLISTSSDACLLLTAGWLNICVSERLLCHQVTSLPGALPTRLVDVGPLYGSLPPISHKKIENTAYLALSHCWGAAKVLQMKGSNFDYLRRCINIDDLTVTFQHAVFTTRRLGYRYLWIVSLCITQDSPHDWEIESQKMAKVYGNSHLAITALWGFIQNGGVNASRKSLGT